MIQITNKFPNLNLKKDFGDATQALEYLNYNSVDFVIVTSKLTRVNGFDFTDKLKEKIEVVLLTKEPEDAMKSYDMGFIDCILKPVNHDRLKKTIKKLEEKILAKKKIITKKDTAIHFKSNFKTEKILADEIKWIESMGDYIKIITNSKSFVVLSTMKSFMKKLPKNQFIRIHKSYIINLKKVINFNSNTVNTDGQNLPLSRNQKKSFKEIFLNL